MERERLFAYGTLNDAEKQVELFGRLIAGAPDALDGYATAEIVDDDVTYRAAVPEEGASIEGRVLEVSEEDIDAADAWEGDAYDRKKLRLKSGAEAWVYVKK